MNAAEIARNENVGAIIIRLMMAVSDLMLSSDAMGRWNDDPECHQLDVQTMAANRYFMRQQVSHLHEAMLIIDLVRKSFLAEIARSPRDVQDAFEVVADQLNDENNKIAKTVRNSVGFHYGHSDTKIQDALRYIKEKHPDREDYVYSGPRLRDWAFGPALWVEEHIMVRQIFKIPTDVNVSEASQTILEGLQKLQDDFTFFALLFIEHKTGVNLTRNAA